MILEYKSSFNIYVFFFFLSIFYWFPFLNTNLIAGLKFSILFLVVLTFFVFKRYLFLKNSQLIVVCFVLFWAFIYQILSNYDFFYFKTIFLMVLFYLLGNTFSYPTQKYNSIFVYLVFINFTWIFLSYFIPQLNFKNNLLLDYEYSEVMLSSTGFALGRTGWGIAVLFITLFFMSFTKSNYLKSAIFLMGFLNVCTTGSRGAIFYFCVSFLIFVIFYIKDIRKKIILIVFFILFYFILFYLFGEVLRLKNSDDFFNGRVLQYDMIYRLIQDNIIMGSYSLGGYSLEDMGFSYKEIHNAWVNFLIKYGIVGFFPLIVFIMYGLFKSFYGNDFNVKNIYIYLIVFFGFFSTFLEPETIFSYGYHVLIFWFCFGYLARNDHII